MARPLLYLYGLSLALLVSLALCPTISFALDGEGRLPPMSGADLAGSGKVQIAQEGSEPAAEAGVPAAEPPARDYLVFFGFDKAEIRPEAASILDRVAQGVFTIGSSSITLTGHADRSGPVRYNQWLSERRAFAVREYLLGKGIAADVIAKGRGEEDPRVATPDGVKEQENRRVEIQIN